MARPILPLVLLPLLVALQTPAPAGLRLGDPCPSFSLPGTDGRFHGVAEATEPLLLVVFLSTECPYVKATQGRINAYARAYAGKVAVLALNANDAKAYPEESMDGMRAQAEANHFVFPYLKDGAQDQARAFGAACTPDFFLFGIDRRLAYRGRLDDNWWNAAAVTRQDLRDATDALLAGTEPAADQVPARGCSIKWKPRS